MTVYVISYIQLEQGHHNVIHLKNQDISQQFNTLGKTGFLKQLLFDISIANNRKNSEMLIRIGNQYIKELKKTGIFKDIYYKIDIEQIHKLTSRFYDKKYALLKPEDLPKKLIENDKLIIKQLTKLKYRFLSLESLLNKERLLKDPLGITEIILKNTLLNNISYKVKLKNQVLSSRDGKHILIITQPKHSPLDYDQNANMSEKLQSIERKIQNTFTVPICIKMLGGHLYEYSSSSLMKRDILLIFILSFCGVSLISYFCFNNFRVFILILSSVIFGVISGFFAITVLFKEIHTLTLVFSSVLIGYNFIFNIHFFINLTQEKNSSDHYNKLLIFNKMKRSSFFSYLITLSVFIILYYSQLQFFREIAVFASISITFTYIFSIFIIPRLFLAKKIQKGYLLKLLDSALYKVSTLSKTKKSVLVKAFLLVAIVLAFYASQVDIDYDFKKISYVKKELEQAEKQFRSRYGDISTSNTILVQGKTIQDVLEKNDEVYRILKKAKDKKIIEHYYNIHRFLPSIKAQKANLKYVHSVDWNLIQMKVEKQSRKLGFKPKVFNAIFQEVNDIDPNTFSYLTLNDIENSPFSFILNELLDTRGKTITLVSYFKPNNNAPLSSLVSEIENLGTDVAHINKANTINEIVILLKGGMIRVTLFALMAIALSFLLFFKKTNYGLIAFLPCLLGIISTIGFLTLIGYNINITSLYSIVVLMAMGSSYSTLLIDINKKERQKSPLPMIISSFIAITSFSVLILSSNEVLVSMGLICFLGLLFNTGFTFILISPIIRVISDK